MGSTMIEGIDYGPLACLVGTWTGDKGMDISPEPDGQADSPYFETVVFEPVGDVTNAESQRLVALRYHLVVSRHSDRKPFHSQTGYWMWEPASGAVTQSLAIPRAVCVLAGGKATQEGSATVLEVKASLNGKWGIVQSPFMLEKARTVGFTHKMTVTGDSLVYAETTFLEIYGRSFDHTDQNTLRRATNPRLPPARDS